ncbi:MAG: site-2 protease family protein [Deltaproteobacteria bacterium]|nr:site-2 protease family protein [Deltaproteobacteria bacterium]
MRVATIARIPIYLHPTFLVLVAGYAGWALWMDGAQAALGAMADIAAIFLSVVLHELGHALVARWRGVYTARITLYPFGGVASMALPNKPLDELLIALGGPAVNGALALVGGALWWATGRDQFGLFLGINLVMGLFNLLPAFPMDGGRVVRALLAGITGWERGTRIAMGLGLAFSGLFIGAGAWWRLWSLALVGAFLVVALRTERERLRIFTRREAMRAELEALLES